MKIQIKGTNKVKDITPTEWNAIEKNGQDSEYQIIERNTIWAYPIDKDGNIDESNKREFEIEHWHKILELGTKSKWKRINSTQLQKEKREKSMNIFISHSSKNADFGNELVELLTGVGVRGEKIIFTSNDAYGIPIGENIFDWLKNKINEKPHVFYLLSPEYYQSVACLNEMGAAWIIENKHTMIFTPNFELSSYEFNNGAIDPREIGFYINNENKIIAFIESLKSDFNIVENPVLINQKVKSFIENVNSINTSPSKKKAEISTKLTKKNETNNLKIRESSITDNTESKNSRLLRDLNNNKFKDEELLLFHYIIDTGKFKLGTGYKEPDEIENIEVWEDIQDLNSTLSRNYSNVLKRFEMKGFTKVSEFTSFDNPKQVKIIDALKKNLLDLPIEVENKINEIVKKNTSNW